MPPSHRMRTAPVTVWQGARRSQRVHFDGARGGLTEPLSPSIKAFMENPPWFPISLSHLLGYQWGADCLALNYWSGVCIMFFPSRGLSRFSKKHGGREPFFSSTAIRIGPRQNESCHWHECRFAIVLLIRLQGSATEMCEREYKTFIVCPDWYDKPR